MSYIGRGDSAATRQGRRGSALFKHVVEHCIRTARYGEFAREDYDRSRGGIHADRARAGFTDPEWLTFSSAIAT